MTEQTKTCSQCGETKPISEFYRRPHSKTKFRGQCKACMAKSVKKYKKQGKYQQWHKKSYLKRYDEYQKQKLDRRNKIKYQVLQHYSDGDIPKCYCCGEIIIEFLTIDHIEGKGAKHRRRIGTPHIYAWLIKNNYPEGFQVLCYNCNWGKYVNGGVCPHVDLMLSENK